MYNMSSKRYCSMNKKIFFVSLLLIIIISLIIAIFFLINVNKKSSLENNKETELKSINSVWNLYINHRLGFSIKIPKEVNSGLGFCVWDNKKNSYIYKDSIVPLKTLETSNTVYITPSYYYELSEKQQDKYLECKKRDSVIGDTGGGWQIIIRNVSDDKGMNDFIKSQMSEIGSGCSMGNKTPTKQSGVYDIEIKGDNKNPEESNCWPNFAYTFKYFPAKNKVAYWFMGQEATFYKDDLLAAYDGEMVDSFEFIE